MKKSKFTESRIAFTVFLKLRSMYYYKYRGADNRALIMRMRDIAMNRIRHGFFPYRKTDRQSILY